MNKRLVMDVTQLVSWKGRPTGIPRVMAELSQRFECHEDTIFVVWDTLEQLFTVIDFPDMMRQKNAQSTVSEVSEPSQAHQMQKRVFSAVKKIRADSVVIRKVSQLPVKVAKKVATLKKLENTPVQWSQKIDAYIPEAGDTMVVFWGDWADPTYRQTLVSLHSKEVSLVQFAYDMLPIVTPQFSGHSTQSLTDYSLEIYPLCTKLLAISEHTKKDVAAWLKKNKKRIPPIEVIRLGDDFNFATSKRPKQADVLKKDEYIICVGTIEARKNHMLLYYAYKRALERSISLPELVIIGRRGWQTDDVHNLISNDPEINQKIHFFENCGDEELSWLYEHCLFSVYPSFYEGWGLPIAESVARHVPCVCSNTSSMPEVAGSLVGYFSPNSVDECLEAMQTLLSPVELKRAKAKTKKYNVTSWDTTYQQVCAILSVKDVYEKN